MIGENEVGTDAQTERPRRCRNFSSFSNDTRLMYNRTDLPVLTSSGRNDRNADLCHLVVNPGLGELLHDHQASILIIQKSQASRLNRILDYLALDSEEHFEQTSLFNELCRNVLLQYYELTNQSNVDEAMKQEFAMKWGLEPCTTGSITSTRITKGNSEMQRFTINPHVMKGILLSISRV